MVFALFGGILLTVFWTAVGEPDKPAASMATTLLAILWLPFFLSFGITLLHVEDGACLSLLLFWALLRPIHLVIWWASRWVNLMAPKISPKKSWEGFLDHFSSHRGIGRCHSLLARIRLRVGIIIGTVVMIAATAGDFAASMVKRLRSQGHGEHPPDTVASWTDSTRSYLLFQLDIPCCGSSAHNHAKRQKDQCQRLKRPRHLTQLPNAITAIIPDKWTILSIAPGKLTKQNLVLPLIPYKKKHSIWCGVAIVQTKLIRFWSGSKTR